MKKNLYFLFSTCSIYVASSFWQVLLAQTELLQPIDYELSTAKVTTIGNQLVVSTGAVKRIWNWTGNGFVTVSIEEIESGREWCSQEVGYLCDWSLPGGPAINAVPFIYSKIS